MFQPTYHVSFGKRTREDDSTKREVRYRQKKRCKSRHSTNTTPALSKHTGSGNILPFNWQSILISIINLFYVMGVMVTV